ncbi:hypothetical protein TNCV_203131 [Trichonephila clavipes]|nr:hypothetical protein TNCV_203131 [Trichonephila clavipes]
MVEDEEKWEASYSQGVFPLNWGGTKLKSYCMYGASRLRPTTDVHLEIQPGSGNLPFFPAGRRQQQQQTMCDSQSIILLIS